MNEQLPNPAEEKRTIAIRVNPEFRGRLDSVLQITGMTVNDAGTEALDLWMASKLADPEIREKALASLDEEERALQARRASLQGLIGEGAVAQAQSSTPPKRGRSS
jgi:hypothetical protein